jgi:hypothetical protein
VAPRRERDDAGTALLGRKLHQRVVGAAELERAHALHVLALEKDLGAEGLVDGARRQHRVRLATPAMRDAAWTTSS